MSSERADQIAAAEKIVSLNPEWRLEPVRGSQLYSYALVHSASGKRARLYGTLWEGPGDAADQNGDIPLYRTPASALKALGFDVVND